MNRIIKFALVLLASCPAHVFSLGFTYVGFECVPIVGIETDEDEAIVHIQGKAISDENYVLDVVNIRINCDVTKDKNLFCFLPDTVQGTSRYVARIEIEQNTPITTVIDDFCELGFNHKR